MKEENFTPTQLNELGARLKTMDKKIDLLTELVFPLREDMIAVKERLPKVEMRLTTAEDAVRIAIRTAIPSLTQRVQRLEKKAGF